MDNQNQFGQTGSNLFADNPQYHNAFDSYFNDNGSPSNFNEAGWGLNADPYQSNPPSRAQPITHTAAWQTPNHLAASPAPGSYGRSPLQSPASYAQLPYNRAVNQQNQGQFQQQYDPALVPQSAASFNNSFTTQNHQPPNIQTITPQTLNFDPHSGFASSHQPTNFSNDNGINRAVPPRGSQVVDMHALAAAVPRGTEGGIFSIIEFDKLASATNSERMGNYINIGKEVQEWPVNRSALPNYVPRKSKSELRKLAGNNQLLLAKLGKEAKKEARIYGQGKLVPHIPVGKQSFAQSPKDKTKGDAEPSSSEESSSEDEESDYTSSDEETEPAPVPSKRPDDPKAAVEYDTIKALWRSKRKPVNSDAVKKGLVDFWEIVNTIRNRWKSDRETAELVEEKSKKTDPVLQGRVKDQRDMIEAAFKAALKHGHRSIVELLAENRSLVYLCYQFLLDRFKAQDLNGSLSRAILETMSLFTTMNEDTLEKTFMVKILPRFAKKGDAKTQFYCKRIQQNAAAATKEQEAQEAKKGASAKSNDAAKTQAVPISPSRKPEQPEQLAGVKRAAGSVGTGSAQKKIATGNAAKPNGAASTSKPSLLSTLKKPISALEATKGSTSQGTTPAAKPKTVTAKPASSGFFSSLQSASKKPGTSIASKTATGSTAIGKATDKKTTTTTAPATVPKAAFSFAETMANLTKPKEEKPAPRAEKSPEKDSMPETPEQKKKRQRQESRRHLRVSFKSADDLVEIRYFTHDPDEELGHDSSQMRDVSDVGGEGRMFKQQHQMMDLDDDEDVTGHTELLEFSELVAIDLSVVDSEERKRNYSKFGGELEPDSPERAARELYEANNLIVFYSDTNDVPPNPREPPGIDEHQPQAVSKTFGTPPAQYTARAHTKKQQVARQAAPFTHPPAPPTSGFDLAAFLKKAQNPPPQQAPPQSNPSSALQNILASLQQSQPQQQQAATPPMPHSFPQQYPQMPPTNGVPPQPPAAPAPQLDLAAIMAAISANQPQAGAMNPGGTAPPPMMGFQPPMPQQQQQQQSIYENPQRRLWREGGDDGSAKRPDNNPMYRTKVCKYWREGKCAKGNDCSYLHEER